MEYNKNKQQSNLAKHGLNFSDADKVLESPFRLDIETIRNNEKRTQSFAYIFDHVAVLTVVHINERRIISFRRASKDEREVYYDWLETDYE